MSKREETVERWRMFGFFCRVTAYFSSFSFLRFPTSARRALLSSPLLSKPRQHFGGPSSLSLPFKNIRRRSQPPKPATKERGLQFFSVHRWRRGQLRRRSRRQIKQVFPPIPRLALPNFGIFPPILSLLLLFPLPKWCLGRRERERESSKSL